MSLSSVILLFLLAATQPGEEITLPGDTLALILTPISSVDHPVEHLDTLSESSPDSLLLTGPTHPSPISWVGLWVTCRDTVSFGVEVVGWDGQLVDTFNVDSCPTGYYSFELKRWRGDREERYLLRLIYDGQTLVEKKVVSFRE